jgi:hypothetical protein
MLCSSGNGRYVTQVPRRSIEHPQQNREGRSVDATGGIEGSALGWAFLSLSRRVKCATQQIFLRKSAVNLRCGALDNA